MRIEKWVVREHIGGVPDASKIYEKVVENVRVDLKDDQMLLKTLYVSVDPYLQGITADTPIGDHARGDSIMQVLEAGPRAAHQPGDLVIGTVDAVLDLTGDVVDKGGDALTKLTGGRDDQITLDKDAIHRIKQDPAFVAHEKELIEKLKARPEYGHESFSVPLSELGVDRVVELGGKSGDGSKWDRARHLRG